MSDSLKGRVAVVTGASRGLGRRVAVRLAKQGASVAIVARGADGLRETEKEIRANGGKALIVAADTSTIDGVERVRREVESANLGGAVSILVNAAGIFGPIQLVKDSDPRRWIETIQVNTIAPYLTCRAFVGGMIAQKWGRVINFTSAAALHPPGPLNSAYATSKVALNQFTRQLSVELAGTGVTANVIHPGDVKTEMWATIRAEANAMGPEGQPYRDWVSWVEKTGGDDPEKAADLVIDLSSGASHAKTTGQFLWIKGGLQAPIASWTDPVDTREWKS